MLSPAALLLKIQLLLAKPIVRFTGIEASRLAQDQLGRISARLLSSRVDYEDVAFDDFEACFAVPDGMEAADERVILYLHGGGYTAGGLDYCKGFGGVLAAACGIKTLCVAYRLAPEHRFPAALDDAETAYRFLLARGYSEKRIVVAGESAGGGLTYCLMMRLKSKELPLPAGLVGISPWADLTFTGRSYRNNVWRDPTLCRESLAYYVLVYAAGHEDEAEVSPIYGNLKGLPPSLLFAGSDEILLDDVRTLHERLLSAGSPSELTIKRGMWHVYPLYGVPESRAAIARMAEFIKKRLSLS